MPSERQRKKTKDDTWGAEELGKSIKDAMRDDSASKPRSRDKDRERRKDRESKDKDREHRKNKDKDREHKKDREKEKDREHRKDRDKDKDRDRKDRDKDKDRDREPRKDRDKEKDREHRKDRDKDREKKREKTRTDDGHKENDRRRDKEDRDRNDSAKKDRKDKEKRHRDREETNGEKKHRRDETNSAHDREKRREEKEGRSDRDKRKEEERRRRKKEEGDNREKEKEKESREERRERKEREKRKQDEEKKSSEKHREEKNGDRSDKNKSNQRSSKQEKEDYIEDEIPEDNNNGKNSVHKEDAYEDAYDDDFEDYDDDFEDEDEEEDEVDDNALTREGSAEVDEIRRAMASENQAMHSSKKGKEPSSSASSSRSGTSARSSRSFVNFVAAKQRQMDTKVWKQSQKRGNELMKLIELDVVNFDLFDMAPVKEYELYIKSFGRSDTKQAFVQCNDDNLDRDIQTEPVESREMWTQHPAEGVAASGGAGVKTDDDIFNEADSLRLTKFLQKAGQAVNILLEEESSENTSGTLKSNQRSIVFSEGYTQLNSQLSFLEGRHVIQAQFHPVQTNLLLTVHSMCTKDPNSKLSQRGLLCVWNVNEPSRPQKILSCKSTPTCCCFSPTKSTFAFAGTVDGSIVVWDLREPSKMHQNHKLDDGEWSIRVPTFSTDGIQCNENHHSAVVTVQPIVAAEESLKASMQSSRTTDDMAGLSFQLASLEEKGVIHFSVVIEIDKPDLAGSESDLGLVPCGKIKLIKTSSVSLSSPSRGLGVSTLKTFHMQLSPLDPNQFFVATDSGNILHGARHGGRIPPQKYGDKLEIPVDIVQIDFSPFGLPVFLAACGDGSIRLYNITSDVPIIMWNNSTNGLGIRCIQWSRSRPSVFYVMDKASKVYVWELLENDGAPVKTEQFTHASLTYMTLSNDHLSAGRGQSSKRPEMLVTDAKGAVDVHRINEKFSTAGRSELDDVTNLFHNMI